MLQGCQSSPRPGQHGTWITADVIAGFSALHQRGLAHSIETYENGSLVGGLYGISLGHSFCGESMFALAPDASKVATVTLLGNLKAWGFGFLDCQVYTDHLARFGAQEWPRAQFLRELRAAVSQPTILGPWHLPLDPQAALERLTS